MDKKQLRQMIESLAEKLDALTDEYGVLGTKLRKVQVQLIALISELDKHGTEDECPSS